MIKIAVTGASGFIGNHVIQELNKRPVFVIAVAHNTHTNLTPLANGYWINMDIYNLPDNFFEALGEPDILIHLAWQGLPNYLSLHHFEKELPAHYNFLRKSIEKGIKSIVVTGTCFEYGMQSGLLTETTETMPSNPYAFAKDALRKELEFLKREYTFNLTWARLFYIYGNGQRGNTLFSQLTRAITQGDSSFNMSGGEQLRDYLHVSKVAEYLVTLALMQKDTGLINVCSGNPQSVRNFVENFLLENKYKMELNLGHYPYLDYEPMAFWGCNRKLLSYTK